MKLTQEQLDRTYDEYASIMMENAPEDVLVHIQWYPEKELFGCYMYYEQDITFAGRVLGRTIRKLGGDFHYDSNYELRNYMQNF